MLKKEAFIFFVIIYFLLCTLLFTQEKSPSSEEIKIIASYKERLNENVWLARGNVEVHYRNIKIFADRAELNTETKDIYAEGNVAIHFPEESIGCEEIHLNLDSSEGELKKALGMLQPTLRYEAESIERKNEDIYSFNKASITSCSQPVPRWKFSCSRANFKKDDYIEMWNPVLSIKKIPVLYLPYMRYPLQKERATGFLIPPRLAFPVLKGFLTARAFTGS